MAVGAARQRRGRLRAVGAALPALRESGAGRIVFISSGAAEEGHSPAAHYVAAKAALHGLCRALAWDAGRDGVLVNAIAAGFTRAPAGVERFGPEIFERAAALTPQRRASIPNDLAALALGSARPRTRASPARSFARARAPPAPRLSRSDDVVAQTAGAARPYFPGCTARRGGAFPGPMTGRGARPTMRAC
jgi:NAD(P)-dependent dehydrogenase (short-subunit alcohol dehydrogenase family)